MSTADFLAMGVILVLGLSVVVVWFSWQLVTLTDTLRSVTKEIDAHLVAYNRRLVRLEQQPPPTPPVPLRRPFIKGPP